MTEIPPPPKPKKLTAADLMRWPVPGAQLLDILAGRGPVGEAMAYKKEVLNIRIDNASEGIGLEQEQQTRYLYVVGGVGLLVLLGLVIAR